MTDENNNADATPLVIAAAQKIAGTAMDAAAAMLIEAGMVDPTQHAAFFMGLEMGAHTGLHANDNENSHDVLVWLAETLAIGAHEGRAGDVHDGAQAIIVAMWNAGHDVALGDDIAIALAEGKEEARA